MSHDVESAASLKPASEQPAVPRPPSATRRVRTRLARRITAQRAAPVKQVLEPLAVIHRELHPNGDLGLLQRAYDVAEELHRNQQIGRAHV